MNAYTEQSRQSFLDSTTNNAEQLWFKNRKMVLQNSEKRYISYEYQQLPSTSKLGRQTFNSRSGNIMDFHCLCIVNCSGSLFVLFNIDRLSRRLLFVSLAAAGGQTCWIQVEYQKQTKSFNIQPESQDIICYPCYETTSLEIVRRR